VTTRPNILVLITDQQSYHAMSCAGNPWLQTPAMDSVAQRGTRFSRAYCSYPLCSPARASQMTGKYPHQVNVNANEGRFFWYHDIPRESLLGYMVAQAGYRCVWAGKDMPPADGSRDFELLCPWGDTSTADHLVAFLEQMDGEQPFLAVGNFVNPHNICEFASGRALPEGELAEPPSLPHLPLLPANHGVPPYEPEIIRVLQQASETVYLPRDYTSDEWRRYLWAYYRLVEKVDTEMGRVLTALERAGLDDSTLVIFTSDHGDGCAAHRWNQKQVLYEEVVRVPMILAGPGIPRGGVDARLVAAGLDLVPTCLDAANVPIPSHLEGRSLLERDDPSRDSGHQAVFIETALNPERSGDRPARNRGRAVITQRWKYSVWAWGHHREQLVDLASDPGEMINLAESDQYASLLGKMRERLHAWCQRTGDTFAVPGYEVRSPQAGQGELEAIREGTRWPWQRGNQTA
jgi:arylsulfatase A-like enzyme